MEWGKRWSMLAEKSEQWQETALWVALLLACALAFSKNQPDPDFWGHVKYGQDMLADGLPQTTTYSYTVTDYPWVNHEIVSELLLALGLETVGTAGLLGIKCLIGVAIVGLIIVRGARRGVSTSALALVALLVALNLMYFWQLRPQLPTFAFYFALLLLLDHCLADRPGSPGGGKDLGSPANLPSDALRRLRWLWVTPLLMIVWTNTHGGVVAGYAVLAIYLCVRSLEVRGKWGTGSRRLWATVAGVLVASALATAINPYGFQMHVWLWDDLSQPRPEIIEWRPPELSNWAWIPWWLLVAVFVLAACLSRRRLGYAEWVVLLITLWQSLEHRRNIPFFVLAFGLWLPGHVEELLSRLGGRGRDVADSERRPSTASGLGLGAGFVATAIVLAGMLVSQIGRMPVARSVYPVSAFQYMADQRLGGKLLLRFMWSQYALAAFGDPDPKQAQVQVAFDGRFRTCYPQEMVDMYFDFALGRHPTEPRYRSSASPPIDGARLLEYGQPDLVLLDRNQPHPVRLLESRRDEWALLYQDELAQLWGRASRYDDPASPHYLPPTRRQITNDKQDGFVEWPAFPQRPPSSRKLACAG